MNTTLVINTKGGVGKTTIATNLASYFASRNVATTIADYDPQGSSLNWLSRRPLDVAPIHGANFAPHYGARAPIGRQQIPRETQQLIIDAPAGPSRLLLQELLGRTRSILIPVAPSSIDIHATTRFIKELLLVGKVRFHHIRLAIVANRGRSNRPVYEPLEKFVASLRITFLARLGDSDAYIEAADAGKGIFDLPADASSLEQREFTRIARWVGGEGTVDPEKTGRKVVSFNQTRSEGSAQPPL